MMTSARDVLRPGKGVFVKSHGIHTPFVEAARIVQSGHPRVRFLLVGQVDEGSPDTVDEAYLRVAKERTSSGASSFGAT